MIPNLDYIKKIADGSEIFEQKMINILKREFPEEKQGFLRFFDAKKYSDASEVVHKIKHKLGILGMVNAYEFIIVFESELKEGRIDKYSDFIVILEAVERFINKL